MKAWGRRRWLLGAVALLAAGGPGYAWRSGYLADWRYELDKYEARRLAPLPARPAEDILFVNVHLVPMTDEIVLGDRTVWVRDGRIAAIGIRAPTAGSEEARTIDGRGGYLMPGLADLHVHMDGDPLALALFIANGVTSVREMSGTPRTLEWARAAAESGILAPTIYTTGPILGSREASATERVINTAAEGRAEVARQYDQGFRLVKPYTFLPAEAYRAIIDDARARGMYSVGHVPYSVGIDGVIAAGQDEIAHIHSLHQDFFAGFDPDHVFDTYEIDERRTAEIAAALAAAGIRVCVTLAVDQALLDAKDPDAYLRRPQQAYAPPSEAAYMRSARWEFKSLWPRSYLRETYLPWLYRLTRALHEAGVQLVLGTDSGVPGLIHGFTTHEELRLLVEAGLTPYEALLTGTRHAAAAAGASGQWGTIEVGARADLILVEGDPLQDIANAARIVGVTKAGQWLDRGELDRLLSMVRESH